MVSVLAGLSAARPAGAATGVDLSDRIEIDGLTAADEWQPDESLFQVNDSDSANPVLEESLSDSRWGFNNDLNQIRVTWDARFLYLAVNAIIWDNNTILLFDYKPGGMTAMTNLNSWRRNFSFQGLEPDMFLATWDGNTQPQVWEFIQISGTVTQKPQTDFESVATFQQSQQGKAMEAAIPWSFVLGADAERFFSPEYNDTVYALPDGITEIRFVGVITAGPDGTGGPDSAPDNLSGHEVDSSLQVTIDNWATIPLDLDGPDGEPDGVVDFGAEIAARRAYRIRPPVVGLRQEIAAIDIDRPVISPEQGGELRFDLRLTPEIPPSEAFRTVTLTAEVRDLRGELVRSLYVGDVREQSELTSNPLDRWDCRDRDGFFVQGGIYVLRVVLEPQSARKTRAFSVVR